MKKLASILAVFTLALALCLGCGPGAALADEGGMDFDIAQWIAATFTEAYMGAMGDGTAAFFAFAEFDDGDLAVLVFLDGAGERSVSFVGLCTDNGDGTITVEDEWNGLSIVVGIEEADGGFLIDLGDLGSGAVAPVSVDEIIDALLIIEEETEAVG